MSRPVFFALVVMMMALQGCQTTSDEAPLVQLPLASDGGQPEVTEAVLPPAEIENGLRIGVLVPLSGAHGTLGRELLDAATLALFDIGRDDIELVVADTGDGGAARAARQVLAARVHVAIGPLFARSVHDATPILRHSGKNTFVFSSDRSVAEPGIFVMGHASENQVARLVTHAVNAGYLRFAVLAPRSAYGERMAEALRRTALEAGGRLTAEVFYDPAGTGIDESVKELATVPVRQRDLDTVIATLRATDGLAAEMALERLLAPGRKLAFDALLVPEFGPLMQRIAAWMGYHDIDPGVIQLLGPETWNDPILFREPIMKGAWFAEPPGSAHSTFAERFQEVFGYEATGPVTLAYDAMALASTLIAGRGGRQITDWRGFGGLAGPFRFNADGTSERLLAIMRMTPDGPVIEDSAPTGFTTRPEPGA